MNNPPPLRWGILGAANIARKNWHGILNSGNGRVVAVASRDLERARAFIADGQRQCPFPETPAALDSYDALLARRDVDAVYIPLPTGSRKEWVMKAAAAGKHIVCEKPCAITVDDLREMLAACRQHRVQFMDGVMFMHSARLPLLRATLDDPSIVGPVRRIQSSFAFGADAGFFATNIRAHSGLEPHGCLGDLGWYCLRLSLWVQKGKMPHSVTGRRLAAVGRPDSPAQVATEFSGELFFDAGASAGYYCSFITELQQWAHISGTQGSVRLDDFVLPHYGGQVGFTVEQPFFEVTGCQFNMEPRTRLLTVPEYSNNHPSSQETNLFRAFAAQVQSGQLNDEWPELALKTQLIMAACLASADAGGRETPVPSLS